MAGGDSIKEDFREFIGKIIEWGQHERSHDIYAWE